MAPVMMLIGAAMMGFGAFSPMIAPALGGIERISFQMNASSLPHAKLMQAIETIGADVAPALRKQLAGETSSYERTTP